MDVDFLHIKLQVLYPVTYSPVSDSHTQGFCCVLLFSKDSSIHGLRGSVLSASSQQRESMARGSWEVFNGLPLSLLKFHWLEFSNVATTNCKGHW